MDSDGVFNSRNPFSNNKPDYSIAHVERQSRRVAQQEGFVLRGFQPPRHPGQLRHRGAVFRSHRPSRSPPSTRRCCRLPPSPLSRRAWITSFSTNNTLTVRLEERMNSRDNAGLGGTSLPAPYSNLAYNTTGDGQNVMVTETAVLNAQGGQRDALPVLPQLHRLSRQPDSADQRGGSVRHRRQRRGRYTRSQPALRAAEQHLDLARRPHHSFRRARAPRQRPEQPARRVSTERSRSWAAWSRVLDAANQVVTDANGNRVTVEPDVAAAIRAQRAVARRPG